ncbi:MAG: hypothetical protein ACLTOG_08550 [Mediterraneibacter faecis]
MIIKLLNQNSDFRRRFMKKSIRLCLNMEGMMEMFSKELEILDRNTVKLMIDEMEEELAQVKASVAKQVDRTSGRESSRTGGRESSRTGGSSEGEHCKRIRRREAEDRRRKAKERKKKNKELIKQKRKI